MTATVPVREPAELRAGNTWVWRREDLADYPASTWTLKYRLKNGESHIEITATADSDAFAVSVAAASTAAYQAGTYRWVAFVESGSERHEIGAGWVTVKPSYNDDKALDDRTFAQVALEAVEAVLRGNPTYAQRSLQIAGRALERFKPAELRIERQRLKGEVYREQLAERMRNGETVTTHLGVRC